MFSLYVEKALEPRDVEREFPRGKLGYQPKQADVVQGVSRHAGRQPINPLYHSNQRVDARHEEKWSGALHRYSDLHLVP